MPTDTPIAAIAALIIAVAAIATAATPAFAQSDVDLIPREVLFGNPERAGVQISPDGQRLSWLAPVGGVLNVWIAPVDDLDAATPVTSDTDRGIRTYFWAFNGAEILYLQDVGGDEDFQLFVTDITTKQTRNLTPFDSVTDPSTGRPMTDPSDPAGERLFKPTARIQEVSHHHPNEILIGLNKRIPFFHDIYRLDLRSGDLEMIQQNDGFAGFVTDPHFRVRLAARPTPDGGLDYLKPAGEADWELFSRVEMEDSLTTRPVALSKDGQVIHMLDSRGRNTAALRAIELASGDSRILAEDDLADIGAALVHPTERHVQAVSANYLRQRWKVLDPKVTDDFSVLSRVADGDFSVTSRTVDDELWTVAYTMDDGPVRYYLYDRDAREARFLFTNRPDLERWTLATMHPVVIPSRDGLNLVSYYTLPVWTDSDGDGLPREPVATVLLVHGGPWARDAWGYSPIHQWLANRGYAVLSVNFRGSTGFGKNFINAGNREWANKMHDDLLDAIDWAVDRGIADDDRVAIMGGSYGGYATLVGLTFTPERFAAGVDIVGPSNLVTLMESIPPHWKSFRDQLRERVGDIDSVEGRIMLRNRSPLTHVDEIVKPLLIGQGANDPRVKQRESDQIVDLMQSKGIPVTYVLYPDEGHGFARPENSLSFFAVAETFLAQHLGGVYEEIGDDFTGSSIDVPVGAEHVPGVAGALDAR